MLFIHTIDKVLSGEKTATRRLVKPGQYSNEWHLDGDGDLRINEVLVRPAKPDRFGMTIGRQVYGVGKTYAVQPGRGQKSVARICITGIRRERVCDISEADAVAEGFEGVNKFIETFMQINPKSTLESDVWVIEFKRVEGGAA